MPASKTGRRTGETARPGLRPVRIWIPDLDERTFREAAHCQSLAVANSPHAKEDQEFIDAITIAE
jgi:Protein  of unknown function (DUF3018)